MRIKPSLLYLTALVITVAITAYLFVSTEPKLEGKTFAQWLKRGSTSDWHDTAKVRRIVGLVGTNAVPALLRLIAATDSHLKRRVSEVAKEYLFWEIPYTSAAQFHFRALQGFWALGQEARPAIPALIDCFSDKKPHNMEIVAWALAAIGEDSIPALCVALRSEDTGRRNGAIRALGCLASQGKLGSFSEPVRERLIHLLESPDTGSRVAAIFALSQFKDQTKPLPERLVGFVGSSDSHERDAAIKAILSLGPDETMIPLLISALTHGDISVRMGAAEHLGRFGWNAKDALPGLRQLTNDLQVGVREAAITALRQIEPSAAEEEAK